MLAEDSVPSPDRVVDEALRRLAPDRRTVVAIAGAPGSGKTTLADVVARRLDEAIGRTTAAILPMDGFHYDNAIIEPRGLLPRKGAPETFDVRGYATALADLRANPEAEVAVPVFDREMDLARACARIIGPDHRIVVTEGNYLLLDRPAWRDLRPLFDLTVMLDVPMDELERRLVRRWLDHGLGAEAAAARARGNDLTNARLIVTSSAAPDITVSTATGDLAT